MRARGTVPLLCLALIACRPENAMPIQNDDQNPPAGPTGSPGDAGQPPTGDGGATTAASTSAAPPAIQDAKRAHEPDLMALPGVVSVGIGLDDAGRPAIIVGLDGPRAETRAELPATLDGYPVVARVVGTIRPL